MVFLTILFDYRLKGMAHCNNQINYLVQNIFTSSSSSRSFSSLAISSSVFSLSVAWKNDQQTGIISQNTELKTFCMHLRTNTTEMIWMVFRILICIVRLHWAGDNLG